MSCAFQFSSLPDSLVSITPVRWSSITLSKSNHSYSTKIHISEKTPICLLPSLAKGNVWDLIRCVQPVEIYKKATYVSQCTVAQCGCSWRTPWSKPVHNALICSWHQAVLVQKTEWVKVHDPYMGVTNSVPHIQLCGIWVSWDWQVSQKSQWCSTIL